MSLHLEIISPENVIFQGETGLAVIPGEEGVMGILPKHSPIVAQLKEGVVELYDKLDGKMTHSFKIKGGFAQTDGQNCIILSDVVEAA